MVLTALTIIGALVDDDDPGDSARPTGTTAVAHPSGSTAVSHLPGTTETSHPTVPAETTSPNQPAPPVDATGTVGETRRILEGIPVRGRAPRTGYERSAFGPAWTDNVDVAGGHNGCDTRNDILRRDLTGITTRPGTNGCVILTGVLDDPFTTKRIEFQRGQTTSSAVQIDHVVALSDAWQKGAQSIGEPRRRAFANDPTNLLAVHGPANQQKSDSDAASWLPKNKAFRCRYVALQTHVKARYDLWMTRAEHETIDRILVGCTDAQVGTID